MVSKKEIEKQLKRLGFKTYGWGRGEVSELHNIILPDEEIYECVNGIYEGGFALLLATDVRVLLVDKKPLNYLTVEDIRFDQINEIDYSHRLLGAQISVASGPKNLKFRSYNQQRLRKLIGHVQHCMADIKKRASNHQEGQNQHLEKMNEQLQAYLLAQQEHQQRLQDYLKDVQAGKTPTAKPEDLKAVEPDPALKNYLYANGLIRQYKQQAGDDFAATLAAQQPMPVAPAPQPEPVVTPRHDPAIQREADLYADGMKEIFGKQVQPTDYKPPQQKSQPEPDEGNLVTETLNFLKQPLEINPIKVAYSKLPMALRNRKFGRPSFHAYTKPPQETEPEPTT